MKSVGKFSAMALVALLFLSLSSFGQATIQVNQPNSGLNILSQAPTALVTLTFVSGRDKKGHDHDGGGNGCGNNGGGWGGDDDRWGGGGNGGGCSPVPEGGSALTYLSLAGLFCVGSIVLVSRKRSSVVTDTQA